VATAANTAALLVEVASIIFFGLIQELPVQELLDGVFRY
jgi:hypothetical protein